MGFALIGAQNIVMSIMLAGRSPLLAFCLAFISGLVFAGVLIESFIKEDISYFDLRSLNIVIALIIFAIYFVTFS